MKTHVALADSMGFKSIENMFICNLSSTICKPACRLEFTCYREGSHCASKVLVKPLKFLHLCTLKKA